MAFAHGLGQGIGDAGANPDHRRLLDPELHGDGVGSLEPDAADVPRKPIGVLGHDLHGIGTVGLEDTDGSGRSYAMAVQEDHDFADDLLICPGLGNPFGAHGTNAGDFTKPIRLGLDDVEYFLSEGLDHLLGVYRTNAADHSGA